jgi:hypothetical protein
MRIGFFLIVVATITFLAAAEKTSESASCPVSVCTFEDLFYDNVLDWTIVKATVTESGGFLILSSSRKAIATAPPTFAGCSSCTVTASAES